MSRTRIRPLRPLVIIPAVVCALLLVAAGAKALPLLDPSAPAGASTAAVVDTEDPTAAATAGPPAGVTGPPAPWLPLALAAVALFVAVAGTRVALVRVRRLQRSLAPPAG
jgi:hypothetical protein